MFETLLKATKQPVSPIKALDILGKAKMAMGEAEEKFEAARRLLNDAIIDSQLGDGTEPTKARQAFDKAQSDLNYARTSLEAAEAIHKASIAADDAEQHSAKVSAIAKHLSARDAAAERLSDAIIKACDAYRALLSHVDAAEAVGLALPAGSLLRMDEIRHAVQFEIHRLGSDYINRGRSFPGGMAPSIQVQDDPIRVPPMPNEFAKATVHALAALKGVRRE